MIMITYKIIKRSAQIKLMIVLFLSAALIIAITSCAAGIKTAKTQREISTASPPTPSKIEAGAKQDAIITRPKSMLPFSVSGTDTIYWVTPERAMFPGGTDALTKFKSKNLKYPKAAKSNNLGGTVMVQLIVNEDGSLSDMSVLSGVSPSLDAEALRVTRLMPPWIPGKVNGKAVKVRVTTSFNFELPATTVPGSAPVEVFVVVEEMPTFPGGDTALMNFIYKSIQYPKNAKEKKIQGRVILRFCVTSEGNVDQVSVLKSVDPELDVEAVRVIRMLPKWQPGKQGGKAVNVWYSVPVTFKLDGLPSDVITKPVENRPAQPLKMVMPTGYDRPPVFKGGESALFKFIRKNIVYPQSAKERGVEGKVMIRFTITESGAIENVIVRGSLEPMLDAEALRVVKLIPAWQPAKFKGAPVKVSYTIPIIFAIK
jgi:TonB family protein